MVRMIIPEICFAIIYVSELQGAKHILKIYQDIYLTLSRIFYEIKYLRNLRLRISKSN